ncbi:hypothetical protein B0T14DRAFT_496389 [Immersiella caudata]|uniref:Plastocyanin-like domain-containing protein n=1 Tax=Immersiella caudata TaxID=314043 RepID=A0AA40BZZ2_9PEZI|nr:hypothetical protein B0T14DRAFT_496389 [Immersiella caudata]
MDFDANPNGHAKDQMRRRHDDFLLRFRRDADNIQNIRHCHHRQLSQHPAGYSDVAGGFDHSDADRRTRTNTDNNVASTSCGRGHEKVTLHFHGVFMDGPELVTQCDLAEGMFIHDFITKNTGTFWIHSHDPGQYPKGLRSPFHWLTSPDKTEYAIAPSTRTRFRFIKMSAFSQFFVLFEQHSVTTTEVDGVLVNSTGQTTDSFTIALGQRVSVIVQSMTNPGTKPFHILVSLNPSLAPSKPEKDKDCPGYCTLPGRTEGLTLFSWGCLSYSGFTSEPCPALSDPLSIPIVNLRSG